MNLVLTGINKTITKIGAIRVPRFAIFTLLLPVFSLFVTILQIVTGIYLFPIYCSSNEELDKILDKTPKPTMSNATDTQVSTIWNALIANITNTDGQIIKFENPAKMAEYCLHFNAVIKICYLTIIGSFYFAFMIRLLFIIPRLYYKFKNYLPEPNATLTTWLVYLRLFVSMILILFLIKNIMLISYAIIFLYNTPLPMLRE
jgi:hypothetical protein